MVERGVTVQIADLRPHPGNYNTHPRKQLKLLRQSLAQFGQVRDIVVWQSYIVAGHGVVAAARELGWTELSAIRLPDDWTEEFVLAYLATDNETAKLSVPDSAQLRALVNGVSDEKLRQLAAGGETRLRKLLEANGYDGEDIEVEPGRAAALREELGVESGQLWTFETESGTSSLYVGPAEQARIACDLAIYDPPFDLSAAQQENALAWSSWRKALLMGLAPSMPLVARNDFLHWWIWDAGMARFGGQGYKPMSGCAIMLAFGEKEMWYEEQGLAVLDHYELDHYGWPVQVVKIQDHLANRAYKHEKPAALWDYAVALYSTTGDVVGDPFAGSGSVAAACVRLKRRYRGAEIEPERAALSLQRVREMGLEPRPAGTLPGHP